MITLDAARSHVGAAVVYRRPWCAAERGVITSVSQRFVLVRYGLNVTAKPTDPDDLDWSGVRS